METLPDITRFVEPWMDEDASIDAEVEKQFALMKSNSVLVHRPNSFEIATQRDLDLDLDATELPPWPIAITETVRTGVKRFDDDNLEVLTNDEPVLTMTKNFSERKAMLRNWVQKSMSQGLNKSYLTQGAREANDQELVETISELCDEFTSR